MQRTLQETLTSSCQELNDGIGWNTWHKLVSRFVTALDKLGLRIEEKLTSLDFYNLL